MASGSRVLAALALCGVGAVAPGALAADSLITPTGGRGQLVIQQVAGVRAGGITAPNVTTAQLGPLGLSYSSLSLGHATGGGSDSYESFGFWIAPSADFFPIDHLSLGGLVQFGLTSTTFSTQATSTSPPASTGMPMLYDVTLVPRVGYLFPIGQRIGIWPRLGLGYALHEVAGGPTAPKTTMSGFLVDLDTTLLYRFNETFFAGVTPELSILAGNADTGGVSVTATNVQIALTTGIGVIL